MRSENAEESVLDTLKTFVRPKMFQKKEYRELVGPAADEQPLTSAYLVSLLYISKLKFTRAKWKPKQN
jgi:hypothetical protein